MTLTLVYSKTNQESEGADTIEVADPETGITSIFAVTSYLSGKNTIEELRETVPDAKVVAEVPGGQLTSHVTVLVRQDGSLTMPGESFVVHEGILSSRIQREGVKNSLAVTPV